MKKFFLDNPTIAFGLGLPLLLVAIFLLGSGVPALLVDAPKHEVLYATGYTSYQHGLRVAVTKRKIEVTFQGNTLPYQPTRLWRYNPATGGVTEIAITLPSDLYPAGKTPPGQEPTVRITPISMPDIEALTLDPSSVAPDGYEFTTGASGSSGRVVDGLFYSGRYRNKAFLRKNGRSIVLPNTNTTDYNGGTQFIGWVVVP